MGVQSGDNLDKITGNFKCYKTTEINHNQPGIEIVLLQIIYLKLFVHLIFFFG